MNNPIQLTGTLTEDAQLRFTNSGDAVVNLKTYSIVGKTKDGENKPLIYFEATAFGKLAELCGELTKDTRVIIKGRLEAKSWEYKDKDYYKTIIIAEDIGISLFNNTD